MTLREPIVRDAVFFTSDAHFRFDATDPWERSRRDRFRSFLMSIRGASRLYLLGDIFDFWFESRGFVPRIYDDILEALADLKASGTAIHICGGNHDWWLGPHITDTLGFSVLPPIATHEMQGLRVTMTHGDSLLPGDLAYKTLKVIIRSRAVVALAREMPPRLLFGFARRFSKASKAVTTARTERSARALIAMAPSSFYKWHNDIFIMGHVHYPHLERFGNRTFAIIGDWERHFSYLALEDGVLSLRRYGAGDTTRIENR
jgi:UDP-2,3-diacylglucosamine hydrolase